MPSLTRAFSLPDRLAAKSDPDLIGRDEEHFALIERTLERRTSETAERLAALLRAAGGSGQHALERDLEIHRLNSRLTLLRRYGIDLCLGRIVVAGDPDPLYIGRMGLGGDDGSRLLVDWRAPAAEPFFAATHAEPRGLVSRRRYRWTHGRVTDYWDEVFTGDGLGNTAALDDQSAFIASLGASRSPQMRDVLATIQHDQDAIIRADSRGALVVDGGPGTGKTVVALHRAAYLLYAEPRLRRGGGVLFVGPHTAYLRYVDDILPSLGEESVMICTLQDLVPESETARNQEEHSAAADLKSSARLVAAVDRAVDGYEQPPTRSLRLTTPWGDATVTAHEWAEAFASAQPDTPHNDARDEVWEKLLDLVVETFDPDEVPVRALRSTLQKEQSLRDAFADAWPVLDPVAVVARLWSSPDHLRSCAPWLTDADVDALGRHRPTAWTRYDLPLIDAARQRVGDPQAVSRRRERAAIADAERRMRDEVIDHLIASDDSELNVMSILRGQDAQNSLEDEGALPAIDSDSFAGPFAHIIVDEAQELTDAQWQMLLRRCPSRSFTIVGDRAQARHGFAESWTERLERVGLRRIRHATLSINYRTPGEVMDDAEPVIRALLPDANVPTSIRRNGVPVTYGSAADRHGVLERWLAEHPTGTACVIGDPGFPATGRVRSLSSESVKGLEFDLVVLMTAAGSADTVEEAVDRYVSMTRATQQLIVLTR